MNYALQNNLKFNSFQWTWFSLIKLQITQWLLTEQLDQHVNESLVCESYIDFAYREITSVYNFRIIKLWSSSASFIAWCWYLKSTNNAFSLLCSYCSLSYIHLHTYFKSFSKKIEIFLNVFCCCRFHFLPRCRKKCYVFLFHGHTFINYNHFKSILDILTLGKVVYVFLFHYHQIPSHFYQWGLAPKLTIKLWFFSWQRVAPHPAGSVASAAPPPPFNFHFCSLTYPVWGGSALTHTTYRKVALWGPLGAQDIGEHLRSASVSHTFYAEHYQLAPLIIFIVLYNLFRALHASVIWSCVNQEELGLINLRSFSVRSLIFHPWEPGHLWC